MSWLIDLSLLIPLSTIGDRQFYAFCRINANLCIDRRSLQSSF
ncbi:MULTISPECIES: hypothetical protein [unclassified Roseofilum]|nr:MULTISPECIES: hypothetical protein [unclassified Roseofilum]